MNKGKHCINYIKIMTFSLQRLKKAAVIQEDKDYIVEIEREIRNERFRENTPQNPAQNTPLW